MAKEDQPSQALTKSQTSSEMQAISQTKSLPLMTQDERIEYLRHNHAQNQESLRNSTTEQVARMLAVVGATIGCPMPPAAVLAKYITMLTRYPPDLIDYAGNCVLEVHKWNTFPKIAEFIDHMKDHHASRRESHISTMQAMARYQIEPPSPDRRAPERGRGPRQIGASLPILNKEVKS